VVAAPAPNLFLGLPRAGSGVDLLGLFGGGAGCDPGTVPQDLEHRIKTQQFRKITDNVVVVVDVVLVVNVDV